MPNAGIRWASLGTTTKIMSPPSHIWNERTIWIILNAIMAWCWPRPISAPICLKNGSHYTSLSPLNTQAILKFG